MAKGWRNRGGLGDRIEAWAARGLLAALRLLSLDAASGLGGWLGRVFGPRIAVTKRARRNLERAFPEKSAAEIDALIRAMWDNLGRTFFEFGHLDHLTFDGPDPRVEVVGLEHVEAMRTDGKPGIFFSAHMANWEVPALTVRVSDMPIHLIYRAPNNPWMDPVFRRRHAGRGEMIRKGRKGGMRALALLKKGEHLGILVDQKMNNGIAVPFFGRDAMTAPALAQFALRMDCPVVPARVERLGGARFRITYFPPMEIVPTGDNEADVLAVMTRVNALLEQWIRARPEQWFWLHRRWPD